jgi:LuxR family maltose regulon positive regulatory protein
MEYLFTEVFSRQPSEITQYLMTTAILDRFCGPLCEALYAPGEDPATFKTGGWEFITWLKQQNLFLIPLDNEKRWFRYHHLFQKLLRNQLQRHCSPEDINALHARASDWFAEKGLIEEAIKHALAGGNAKAATQLIAKHGFDLLDNVQWPRLHRWLKMLPGEIVAQEPELLVLSSWLHQVYSRFTELDFCLNKAEALCTKLTDSEVLAGHINALRLFQHYLALNAERGLTCARRALKKLPQRHRWARMFTFLAKGAAHQMLGDREKAIATFEKAMRESDLSKDISQSHYLANPCFIYWMEADLPTMLQTARRALRSGDKYQTHHALAQGLYFEGIAHYHQNNLQAAEEKLAAVITEPYAQYVHNFAHSAFALALVHQARGRTDAANQIGESVVSYGLDTHHPDVLKLARAFQAELALRQGRMAQASHWAEQFAAQGFSVLYRFYVPQLTLVRVLLAQNTRDSREQAADLLKQLYDFVIFTHNKRFQIDVLALQALFYDSQDEGPAALKSLARAVKLAEPGGFIRLFVDEGARMANLLKRLQDRNVAVDYIRKILDAFEQKIAPETAKRPSATAPQPLVEPLTNRELDVLELLDQRLSNKEIADKLFIAPTTVKGHLKNIYQKLDVGKRREAVEKARKVGIL